jgi:drug/metabolite transporter (DMT)-like permease
VPIAQLATLQILVAALIMAVTLPLGGPVYLSVSPRLVLALLITGLFATAAAFTIQSWAQQHLPPTHTALLLTLEPVFAWLTSFFFLGERLNSRSFAGALLILTGILLTELLPHPSPISEHPL